MLLVIGLLSILAVVFVAPFVSHKVERNLEVFLFAMGLLAAILARVMDIKLVEEALLEPVKISLAVLIFGMVFKYLGEHVHRSIGRVVNVVPLGAFVFLTVVALGFLSSIITAIIASLFLVEIVRGLNLTRKMEVRLTILACFAIGLGAALTPVGEPLSTIAIAKLKGEPYHADFFFLARLLGVYIGTGIIGLAAIAVLLLRGKKREESKRTPEKPDSILHVLVRSGKVYLFVMALIFLGAGFKPLIDLWVVHWPSSLIYWVNIVSAALDNATLAAAEISPNMTEFQIRSALVALLISGGILIPGNIPNIIAAAKLKIGSREWARFGLPLGLAMMVVYFVILSLLA